MTHRKRTMTGECKGNVGLYRFYNVTVNKHGEMFSLCEHHRSQQVTPNDCILEKLAENSVRLCERDGH